MASYQITGTTISGSTGNGGNCVDLEVTLGAGKSASSCRVVVSDPGHVVGKALVNHSLSTGGIQPIVPETPPVSSPGLPKTTTRTTGAVGTGAGTVATGAEFTPQVKAALDVIALLEVPAGSALTEQGYYAQNAGGFFNPSLAANTIPTGLPGGNNIGRYQFNKIDYDEARAANPSITGYIPLDQDKVALFKLFRRDRGGKELAAGNLEGFFEKAANEWKSIPWGSSIQVQSANADKQTKEYYRNYYKERLAYHSKGSTSVPAQPSSPSVLPPVSKQPSTGMAQEGSTIKGSPLQVTIFDTTFSFLHQSTTIRDNYTTEIGGQSGKFLMSRRARSKTEKNIDLKALTTKILTKYGLTLDWQVKDGYNPSYTHIDQTGITDYQLLYREVSQAGLLMTDDNTVVTVRSIDRLQKPVLVLSRGSNLISYEIKDTAVSASSKSASSLLSQEAPTEIDPLTGTVVNQKTVDTVGDNSNPGSSLKALAGSQNVKDTRDSRARLTRLYGLPSSFTVVMSPTTVKVSPLDTLETTGFGGVLDRVWLVDRIVHNISANTTTFSLVSPIDVKDLSPAPPTSVNTDVPKGFVGSGSWIYPTNGIVTSGYGNRNAPLDGASTNHRGIDIAGSKGLPIYAPANGVVTEARTISKAGLVVRIDHGNGYTTEYFHCDSILTRPGLTVKQGDQIATQGTTGNSTGVHLHFGVKKNGSYISPTELFPLLASKGTTITALVKV